MTCTTEKIVTLEAGDIFYAGIGCDIDRREKLTNLRLMRRVAKAAVGEAARFRPDEIAVATEIKADGSLGSSMWCRASQLPAALEPSKPLSGPGKQLVFLEAKLWGPDGRLAVHATATACVLRV